MVFRLCADNKLKKEQEECQYSLLTKLKVSYLGRIAMSYNEFLALINENTSKQIDYKWLCRFCLKKKSNGVDASSAYTLLDNYYTITKQCLPVTPEYPNFVCSLCERRLNDYALFSQQITENAKNWETFLKSDKDVKFQGTEAVDSTYHESYLEITPVTKIEEIKIEYCENSFDDDDVLATNADDVFDTSTTVDDELHREVDNNYSMSSKLRFEGTQNDNADNTNILKRNRARAKTISTKLNTTEFDRTCKLCNIPFSSMRGFYSHQRQQHPGEKLFTCDICGSTFNRKERMARHMSDRHAKGGRKYQCQFCAKMFFSDRELKGHELTHLNARNYTCNLCGKSFNQKTTLNTHLKSKAHNAEYKTIPQKKVYRYPNKPAKIAIRCELCIPPITFSSVEEKAFHRNSEHKRFECDICKNTFMAQESLDSHKLIHSDKPRPYLCTICNSSFIQSSHLSGHIKRKHTENKSFQCSYCDKAFFEGYEAIAHEKLAHRKQERVKCEVCSCDFASEKYRKVHMLRQHSTGILRYDCKFCGKRLSNGVTLKGHLARHHSKLTTNLM